ncbi:MAG: hypothetical protein ACOYJF_05235 [Prevotella sp.]
MKIRYFFLSLLLALLALASPAAAAQNNNEQQAKKMLMQAYNKVFGAQGCFLRYDAHLSFFFHSKGWASMKKGKYAYDDTKTHGWCDGKNYYYLDRKKKEVQILNGHSAKNGSVMDKFTFHPDDYSYRWASTKEGYVITIKAKKNVSGVKTAKVLLDRKTQNPLRISVRIAFLWAKVDISQFRQGNINDSIFYFPRNKYKDYKIVDKRK